MTLQLWPMNLTSCGSLDTRGSSAPSRWHASAPFRLGRKKPRPKSSRAAPFLTLPQRFVQNKQRVSLKKKKTTLRSTKYCVKVWIYCRVTKLTCCDPWLNKRYMYRFFSEASYRVNSRQLKGYKANRTCSREISPSDPVQITASPMGPLLLLLLTFQQDFTHFFVTFLPKLSAAFRDCYSFLTLEYKLALV